MRRRNLLSLPAVVAAFAAVALALPGLASAATAPAPQRGIQLDPEWYYAPPRGTDDDDLAREVDAADSMHAGVARVVLPWHLLEPNAPGAWDSTMRIRVDSLINELKAENMKAVVVLFGTPCWATTDPAACEDDDSYAIKPAANPSAYGAAAGRVIDRWGSGIAALEVWNEPSLPESFDGTPEQYAGLVNAAAASLSQRSWPGDLLAAGDAPGEWPYGSDWMQQLYDAGMHGQDGIAVHPYDFNWTESEYQYIGLDDPRSIFESTIDSVRAEMRANGDSGSGIWLTEFGMPVCPLTPSCVDEHTQATSLVQRVAAAEKRPFVRGSIVFTLRDQQPGSTSSSARFGVLRYDFSEREAAGSLRTAFGAPPATRTIADRTLTVTPATGGSVTGGFGTLDCGTTCSARFDDQTRVPLVAEPAEGYRFESWVGCPQPAGDECKVPLGADATVGATFKRQHVITVWNAGGGTVTSSPAGIDCGQACSAKIDEGTVVTLTPAAIPGFTFTGWSGCSQVTGNQCKATMSADAAVSARFDIVRDLTVANQGSGSLTGDIGGIDCGTACSAKIVGGQRVILTATPAAGYQLASWSGCDIAFGNACAVYMASDHAVTAKFTPRSVLTVQRSGQGSVTSAPAAIDCGVTCTASLDKGAGVTLTAAPASGYRFTGWTGCPQASGAQCALTMDTDRTVMATFVLVKSLTVTSQGPGGVVGDSDGIDCGTACATEVTGGRQVILIAKPGNAARFDGWTGCDIAYGTACAVYMSADHAVGAKFTQQWGLVVRKTPGGTVAGSPPGFDCGPNCSAVLDEGTQVTLNAVAADGYEFAGWDGCPEPSGSRCAVTMSANATITANFGLVRDLTVTRQGPGSVVSEAEGIDCGTACAAEVRGGRQVVLTAKPEGGARFAGWSGCDISYGTACAVYMSRDHSVSADFVRQRSLAVHKSGPGSVTSAPAAIDCGPTCSAALDDGSMLTLTATPADGYKFTGWTGCAQASGAQCTVTMSADRSVSATFVLARELSVTTVGAGTVKSDIGGIDCGGSCHAEITGGQRVVLTATPASGYRFAGWTGCDIAYQGSCAVYMASDHEVTARFTPRRVLTVQRSGSGSVASSQAAIDCGSICSADIDQGATITLTAAPADGYELTGWNGCAQTSGSQCTVTMDADRTVSATFVLARQLSVTTQGAGSVKSDIGGIDCGAACHAKITGGQLVVLTATPAAGNKLGGWNGCDIAYQSSCAVYMSIDHAVGANFVPAG